ncbi:MAG: hypothetical protein ACE5G2_12100 [Candidatus Krumholzibacteriia bacterium]
MSSRGCWALLVALGIPVLAASEPELRVGGSLGFGMRARRQAGDFIWDWDSAREETTLAELKLGFRPAPGLDAFIRLAARLDESRDPDAPRLEVGEASLRYRRRLQAGDSLEVRYFARQPSALWLDHGLRAPVDPRVAGGDNVQGVRADLRWRALFATLVAADRSGVDPADASGTVRDGDVLVLRLRGDATRLAGMRLGATFAREIPDAAGMHAVSSAVDAGRRDLYGFDLRLLVRDVNVQIDYSQVVPRFATPAAEEFQEPGRRSEWTFVSSRRLTDIMPSTAALRAEVRSSAVGNERWGWLGFAPAYRAVGRHHTNRLVGPEPDIGSPTRGLEGYRLEAWYQMAFWPVWVRHVYDRHTQFRDADRRVIRQVSEIEGVLLGGVRSRLRYTQMQVHETLRAFDEHHDDLLFELRAEDRATHFRAQLALLDLDSVTRRDVLALETGAHVAGRLQAVARMTFAREQTRLRRGFFAELQYWHLPEFEVSLRYGPEWLGDAADPVLDADLAATATHRDVVRLHFRGWF